MRGKGAMVVTRATERVLPCLSWVLRLEEAFQSSTGSSVYGLHGRGCSWTDCESSRIRTQCK